MKKSSLLLAALLIAVVVFLLWIRPALFRRAAMSELDSLVRIHFAGAEVISGDANSAAFTNEFCSPEARALENQTLDKLSRAPGTWFKNKLPAGASDGSSLLRPLLDDFLKSEWLFQMRAAPDSPEYALAIRLNADRAQLWQTNLRSLLETWTAIKAKDISNGWELKKDLPPNLFRIVSAGDWLIVGCGNNELPLSDAWSAAGKIPENDTNWLDIDLDWPRLTQIFPALATFDFPTVKMQAVGVNGNFQVNGKFELSQPLPPLEKWQTPAKMIHQPLNSFTAIRGFAPWLEKQSWAKLLELSPEPDQAFIWSLGQSPLQTFIAAPVTNATNALAQLGGNLATNKDWEKHLMTTFAMDESSNRISWGDVPFIAPEILALNEPYGDYLFADVFQNAPRGKAPPQQLLLALDRDDLVFYHWEITSERLNALPQLTQLAGLLTQHRQLDQGSAANKWLTRIGPQLGNCVTEVTQTGPTELTLSRTAPAGLTAIELIALANWLEVPNFPALDFSLPPPDKVIPHHKGKKLAAPVTSPPPAAPH